MQDLSLKIYMNYLNVLNKIHYNLFELYLKFLGYSILDYTRFYYFEYGDNYLIYNSDYNNLSFVKNHISINRIDNISYYEEYGDRNKVIFKFDNKKNIISSWKELNLDNYDFDRFFNSLNEEELSYVQKKINRLSS